MTKKILLIFLALVIPLFVISCRNTEDDSPVVLNNVDINAVSNNKLLSIIKDNTLEEGVYLIETKSNKYVFFNGSKNNYLNVSSTLEHKTLIISAKTEKGNSNKKLYLIREKNTTSSNAKSQFYDGISLLINNKESYFQDIILIK